MDGSGGIAEDVAELLEGSTGLGVLWWEDWLAIGLAKGDGEIMGGCDDGVIGGGCGHFDFVGKPVDGVDDTGGIGGRGPNGETPVMVEAWADVVAADGVDGKGFTSGGGFMS